MFTKYNFDSNIRVAVDESGEKWGINMLMGESNHTIDDKGRIIIPAKFREELGRAFIITRGLEQCLFVYPKPHWDKIVNKLKSENLWYNYD